MRNPVIFAAAALGLLAGCSRPESPAWQGYCEGDFVYVAAPTAGRLEALAVQKGTRIEAGAPLFTLERTVELANQREAEAQVQAAEARATDLRKGSRPSELAALAARLEQARAAAPYLNLISRERKTYWVPTRSRKATLITCDSSTPKIAPP